MGWMMPRSRIDAGELVELGLPEDAARVLRIGVQEFDRHLARWLRGRSFCVFS